MREIGRDRQLVRLNQDMTQQALAVQTGLSRLTINQVGNGRPISTLTLVQLLRALGRLDVGSAGGSAAISPLQAASLARQTRQRASRRNDNASTTGP